MNRMIVALAAGAAVASSAFGAGTAISGNSQYDTFSFGATTAWNNSASGGDGNLRVTGASGTDYLSKNTWYYRNTQTNLNKNFLNGLVSTAGGNVTESAVGDTHTQKFNNASDNGIDNFSALFTNKIFNMGANTALVYTTLKIKNNAATARTLQIFNALDFDLNGTGNEVVSYNSSTQTFTYTKTGGATGYHRGFNATGVQAGTTSAIRGSGGVVVVGGSNLNGTTSASSTNSATAFQWTLNLAAGQEVTIEAAFAINTLAIPTPGSLALIGLGGLVAGRRRR